MSERGPGRSSAGVLVFLAISMDLVTTILIGLGVGVMVELLLPGHTPSELFLAMLLGIAGALLARFAGISGNWFEPGDAASYLAAVLGAVILLLIYGGLFRRRNGK